MKPVHACLIRAQLIMIASEQNMMVEVSNNENFRARGDGSILDVPIEHVFNLIQNGWTVLEVFQNESCYDEATA